MAKLLVLGGLAEHEARGWAMICHGQVRIEEWTIGIGEGTLPRWVLRGVTISSGERSMWISEDGAHVVRRPEGTLA